jgi:hypothetical protein
MILDRFNLFSDDQEISDAAATEASTNIVDLQSAGDAEVKRSRLHIVITELLAGTGTTMTFALQTSVDAAFTSPVVLWTTAAIAKATLVAGYQVTGETGLMIPSGCLRFLRIFYTGDDTFETTGKCDAFLSLDAQSNKFPGAT